MFDGNGNLAGLPFCVEAGEGNQSPTEPSIDEVLESERTLRQVINEIPPERLIEMLFQNFVRNIQQCPEIARSYRRAARLILLKAEREGIDLFVNTEQRQTHFQGVDEDAFYFTEERICEENQEDQIQRTLYVRGISDPIFVEVRRARPFAIHEICRPSSCVGCKNYHGVRYGAERLICGMHPYGWGDETCPDFEEAYNDL